MDEICCEFGVEYEVEGELVDTYGGDYTFKDVVICKNCSRVFEIEYGARTYGTRQVTELYGEEAKAYLD